MAVFTEVSEDEARVLMQRLGLGDLCALRGIEGGIENTNYFASTLRDGVQHEYVLTLFERLTAEQLPFYLYLMKHLAQRGVAVPDPQADRFHDHGNQTLALIAHDACKQAMLDFADRNFDVLSQFRHRVATGTTGQRLNALAWSKGWPEGQPWVQRFNSGPLGGDAQIADLVLERQCQRAVFFEDPHVARQHETDIQLPERAVTTVTDTAVCMTSDKPPRAERRADAARRRLCSRR